MLVLFIHKHAHIPGAPDVFIRDMTDLIDVKALSNDMLVEFGKKYAREQEYSIDSFGILALHNRIEKRQTIDHAVTMDEAADRLSGRDVDGLNATAASLKAAADNLSSVDME